MSYPLSNHCILLNYGNTDVNLTQPVIENVVDENNKVYTIIAICSNAFNNQNSKHIVSIYCPYVIVIYDNAFYNCSSLRSVNFSRATYIGKQVFKSCTELTHIIMSLLKSIGEQAFHSCKNITDIIFSFGNCTWQRSLSILPFID